MGKRLFLVLLNVVLFLVPAWSEGLTIDLKREENNLNGGGRSVLFIPVASICGGTLSVVLSEITQTCVQITVETSSQATIVNESFELSDNIIMDVSSLSSGNYHLRVYAFGCWWTGTFFVE